MVTIESALQVINQYGGNLNTTTGKVVIPSKALGKEEIKKAVHVLKKAGPDKVKAVLAFVPTHCLACQYHDTGPTPDGTSIIHWCGPFKESGCIHWLNIAELTACPKGKWGLVSQTVH
jgi:deoxyribose-phosphate aldolase